MERVRNLLPPQAAIEVLKIFISPGEQEDKEIWAPEKNGKFSVKSAIQRNGKERLEGESSNVESNKRTWKKKIWNMQISNQGESLCLESMQKWVTNKAPLEEEESNN